MDEIDPAFLEAWHNLELRSLEKNPYLSPHFVLPALRHLPGQRPFFITVEEENTDGGRPRLACLGLFEPVLGSWRMPFPHLRAFRSPHSYITGLLIDEERGAQGLRSLSQLLTTHVPRAGIEFLQCGEASRLLLQAGEQSGGSWHAYRPTRRAVLNKAESGDGYIETLLSGRRKKALRRAHRMLAENGAVSWRVIRRAGAEQAAEVLLDLEHRGWKGRERSSLQSDRGHEQFFREIVARFAADNRVFFTELLCGRRVVASTINLVAGPAGFAFKIGWDPDYAASSPGLLNEVEFVRHFPREFPELEWVDSGAGEGSFIEMLWRGRRELVSGFYATCPWSKRIADWIQSARKMRASFRHQLPDPTPATQGVP